MGGGVLPVVREDAVEDPMVVEASAGSGSLPELGERIETGWEQRTL